MKKWIPFILVVVMTGWALSSLRQPPETGFRLRCSDYRVFFDQGNETTIEITGVRHRREAYR